MNARNGTKNDYIIAGILGELFLIISYLLGYFVFGYLSWIAMGMALVVPVFLLNKYLRKSEDRTNEIARVLKISFGGAATFTVSAWLAINHFAPFIVNDISDEVLPYIYTLRMGGVFLIVFVIAGYFITCRPHE